MRRTSLTIVFLLSSSVAAARAQAPPTDRAPEPAWRFRLAGAIRTALEQNPDLRAMALRVEAARRRVPQAAVLPDPEIELGLRDVPVRDFSLIRDDFTMEMVGARQALPGPGKRAARRSAAEAELGQMTAEHRRHRLEVAAQTAEAFFLLAEIDRSLTILEQSRARLERAAASATELYRVGKASQADALGGSLKITRLDEGLLTLRAERRAQAARFNAALGLPAAAPVAELPPLGEDFDRELAVPTLADLERFVERESPEVRVAQAAARIAEAELALAGLEERPDWMVSGYYGRRERFEDMVGLAAAINLPWARRSRLAEKRAEKEAELAAAQEGLEAVRTRLRGEIAAAYAEVEKNREQSRLYREVILPQAEIHFQAAREAYTVGRVDFLTFMTAALDLDDYLRDAVARAAGLGRAAAALQRVSGVALLPGTPDQGEHDEPQMD
jgi:cobalt-zinc-cadmium efflux system outer membrane protein